MKIVNKYELGNYPVGTIYAPIDDYGVDIKELRIKFWQTYNYSNEDGTFSGWLNEIGLKPEVIIDNDNKKAYSGICPTGKTCMDYTSDQLFAVCTKEEVSAMITLLQKALDGNLKFAEFETKWYGEDENDIITNEEAAAKDIGFCSSTYRTY